MNNCFKKPFIRQVERWLVSLAMATMAFVIEKALLRSIRRRERSRYPTTSPQPKQCSVPPQHVDDQPNGKQTADDTEHRGNPICERR